MGLRNRMVNTRSDRRRLFQSFVVTVKQHCVLCFAFGLWWTWIMFIYQSSIIFPKKELSAFGDVLIPSCIGPIVSLAVTLVVIAVAYRSKRFLLSNQSYFVAVTIAMSLGAILAVLWKDGGISSSQTNAMIYGALSLLLGCSSACMYIEFNRVMGWLGLLKTLFLSVVSVSVGSVTVAVLSILPTAVVDLFFVGMPALMSFILMRDVAQYPRKAYYEHGRDADLPIPGKFIATSFAEGLTYGLVFGGFSIVVQAQAHTGATLLSNICAIAILTVGTFFFKLDFNRLVYQIGFPLMGCGVILMGVSPNGAVVASAINFVGYGFLDFVLWGLGSYLIKNAGLPAIWMTACPSGALFLGLSVGIGLGCVVQGSGGDIQQITSMYAFLLILVALFLSNNKNMEYGWGTIKPSDSASSQTENGRMLRSCQLLSNEYELTKRETDTLLLLLQGRTRKEVAENLVLSENTVKTHIRNLYRKLGIRSQGELLELIEQMEPLIDAGA